MRTAPSPHGNTAETRVHACVYVCVCSENNVPFPTGGPCLTCLPVRPRLSALPSPRGKHPCSPTHPPPPPPSLPILRHASHYPRNHAVCPPRSSTPKLADTLNLQAISKPPFNFPALTVSPPPPLRAPFRSRPRAPLRRQLLQSQDQLDPTHRDSLGSCSRGGVVGSC